MRCSLAAAGYSVLPGPVEPGRLAELRGRIFRSDEAGTRCLLDDERVREAAVVLGQFLAASGHLPAPAAAIQAIAFDKTAATNWKVTWHQDVMFPLAEPARAPGYDLATVKAGVPYARPPREVLEALLAVRLHLDPCGPDNGPLRVAPGSHQRGVIPSREIAAEVERCGAVPLCAATGDLVLLRPLLLHASSKAVVTAHRRVLHLVFHHGAAPAEKWHRAWPIAGGGAAKTWA